MIEGSLENRLDILVPCVAWHGAAHIATLHAPTGATKVLALLGPEGAAADAAVRARAAAASLLGASHPGLHRLLAVEAVGDRVGWAFEAVEAIGLAHTVGTEGRALLPTRAAAEVAAAVADTLMSVGPEHRNRGPEPTDLLVTAEGRVVVSGFAGPYPMAPSMRAPKGDDGEAAAVYRLGVLLGHLLAGVAPPPAGERHAHAAVVRRTLIRIMARPGPALPERYADWIRGMLAWEPGERPPLSTVAEGLRAASAASEGPGLEAWCVANVPALRAAAEAGRSNTPVPLSRAPTALVGVNDDPTDVRYDRNPDEVSTRSLDATPVGAVGRRDDDDPTQEATRVPDAQAVAAVPTRPGAAEMPIRVGPPPEAIKDAVSLPSGFLDTQPDEPTNAEATKWVAPATFTVWAAVVGVLLASALLLAAYVFWPSDPVDDGPQLQDVLNKE